MKKVISLTLSLLMLFSCFSVLSAGALDAGDIADTIYTEDSVKASADALMNLEIKNRPGKFYGDIRALSSWTDADKSNDVSLLGMDLDYLYNGKGEFEWGFLDVFTTDELGNRVLKISLDDVSLAFTNLNSYLQKLFYNYCGGIDFYTVENAVAIANFIGTMLRPDFTALDVDNFKGVFNNKVPSTVEFYKTIATISTLADILEYNWIGPGKGKNFCEPVIKALGGSYVDFFDNYYEDGVMLGAKLIEATINQIKTAGPIEYVLELLKIYSSSAYSITYREPTLALFSFKKDLFNSQLTTGELNSLDGLLKLIFCDCDPIAKTGCFGAGDVDHLCLPEFPAARYSSASDSTERVLYLYYYLNLCGAYGNNDAVIDGWKQAINASSLLTDVDKGRVNSVFNGFFLGNLKDMVDNSIVPLYKEGISTVTDSFSQRFRNTLMSFLKKIADYFDYLRKIFSGELQYGQGNSPFN